MKKLLLIIALFVLNFTTKAQTTEIDASTPTQVVQVATTHGCIKAPTINCFYSNDESGSLAEITAISSMKDLDLQSFKETTPGMRILIVRAGAQRAEILISPTDQVSDGERYGLQVTKPDGTNQWLTFMPEDKKTELYAMIKKIVPIEPRIDPKD